MRDLETHIKSSTIYSAVIYWILETICHKNYGKKHDENSFYQWLQQKHAIAHNIFQLNTLSEEVGKCLPR